MAILIVTHDRRFLKRVASRIFDLDRGELSGWECDYQTFLKRKAELLADEAVYWERKSKKLAEEEAWIRRGVKARTTRNEGRVAALMKLREEFASRRQSLGKASMRLDTAVAGGEQVLKIENLGFSYGERTIVRDFTANVLRGERIGILGKNGAGKTTLLKLLTNRLEPQSGRVVLGSGVEMAFLDQLREELDDSLSVGENIASDRDEVVVGGVRKHVYSYLSDFLFTSERVRTPVKALSGGERQRLMLAKLFLKPANLLIMDEPTNDLDIETLELLEEQLLAYRGTLLLVSHDRDFLDNVVTSTFVLEGDGSVDSYPGGYEDYFKQRREVAAPKAAEPAKSPAKTARPPAKKKLSYNEQRELAALPRKIDAMEREIAEIESFLCDSEAVKSNPEKCGSSAGRMLELKDELEKAVERWAELEELAGG
jgi:ATP-binding cassette subfamily F protein uup